MKLTEKLIICILCICISCVLIAALMTSLFFNKYFAEYLMHQQQQMLTAVADDIIDYYDVQRGWRQLRQLNRVLRESNLKQRNLKQINLREDSFTENRLKASHSTETKILDDRSPPQNSTTALDKSAIDNHRSPNHNHRPRHEKKPRPRGPVSITLTNADRIYVAGNRKLLNAPEKIWFPVRMNDQVIGYLMTPKSTGLTQRVDQQFKRSLQKATVFVIVLISLLCIPLVLFLARYIAAPIRQLSARTQQLVSGDYQTQVNTSRMDEIGDLYRHFNILADTLALNQSNQQRWIADISHELRTPLAVLKGELQAMEDGIRPLDKTAILSLSEETHRFQRIVEDLYDLSRAEAGELAYQKQPCDPIDILNKIVYQFEGRFSEQQLTLVHQLPSSSMLLPLDETRMAQLFSNLLENSLRYTDTGGTTHIHIQQSGERFDIIIEDSAPSVPDDALPQLFDRLYRVESSRNRHFGGSGLGLAMCQSIANAHQASLSASHSDLGGIKITLSFTLTANLQSTTTLHKEHNHD